MLDDGHVELSYQWFGGDGWSDSQVKMVNKLSDIDRSSDRLVEMVDKCSDVDGWSYRWGNMAYRWLDIDRQSDGLIAGWMGGVTQVK